MNYVKKLRAAYHIPVFRSAIIEPPVHIMHITVEVTPIAKVGGCGDVVNGLSRTVNDLNHHMESFS